MSVSYSVTLSESLFPHFYNENSNTSLPVTQEKYDNKMKSFKAIYFPHIQKSLLDSFFSECGAQSKALMYLILTVKQSDSNSHKFF